MSAIPPPKKHSVFNYKIPLYFTSINSVVTRFCVFLLLFSLDVGTYSCSRGTINEQLACCAVAATTARELWPLLYPLLVLQLLLLLWCCVRRLECESCVREYTSVHNKRPGKYSLLIAPAAPAVEPPALRGTFAIFFSS